MGIQVSYQVVDNVAKAFRKSRTIWWPLLGLNQRPSDYESQFEAS